MLKQHIGKAAGGRAAVNAVLPGGIDGKHAQRLVQLEAAAADEWKRLAVYLDLGVRRDRHSRLIRTLAVYKHMAAHYSRFGALTALRKPKLKNQLIQSDLFHITPLFSVCTAERTAPAIPCASRP